ncbi:MAG: hypothetical protein N3G20_03020 [Verrucomicrobiae bacterium]|nr:hypothetical protein [Verrucomicrobiae bacterium]
MAEVVDYSLGMRRLMVQSILWLITLLAAGSLRIGLAVSDLPFKQPISVKFTVESELEGATWQKACVDRDGIVYILTDRGVARAFDNRLAVDKSFRPIAGKKVMDIAVHNGRLFYLLEDKLLSNGSAGKPLVQLPSGVYRRVVYMFDGTALLAGATNLALVKGTQMVLLPFSISRAGEQLYAWGDRFYVLANDTVYRVAGQKIELFHKGRDITVLGFRSGEMLVGTKNGYYGVSLQSGNVTLPLQDKLPWVEITSFLPATNGLWFGTTRGLVFQAGPKVFRYYASKRWLNDDRVMDIEMGRDGAVLVLTGGGLNRLEFRPMTLADKAFYYDRKIRQRHIRYGFCSELRLTRPGDPTSAEMIDTDNDGLWSSFYMASQAFRYAVTGDEEARANAWETFEALERLQSITGLDGFPARTFERAGFKFSDPDRWHASPEAGWEWKGTTSSDEIVGHTFGYAVLYEAAARTPAERQRIANAYDRIISHILRHNLYLVDRDGRPTLWGRWNPEYVNHFPPTIFDRRLNSAEIIAFLQFAFHVTQKPEYKARALELMQRHGYLQNILSSMANIRFTPNFAFQGIRMGDEWNHSDDELAFATYWVLVRYAFTDDLRRQYVAAVRDHWEIEKVERNPLWNFIYAATGASFFDVQGAIWTLQMFPLDLVTWTVENSHRRDVVRLPANFRRQTTEQLLPPDERPVMRWNGNPFDLDGGDGGQRELAGEEFLLPYWMGRYLRIIQ